MFVHRGREQDAILMRPADAHNTDKDMFLFEKSGYASPHSHCAATPVEFPTLLAVTLSIGITVDYRIPENGVLSRNFAKTGAYQFIYR